MFSFVWHSLIKSYSTFFHLSNSVVCFRFSRLLVSVITLSFLSLFLIFLVLPCPALLLFFRTGPCLFWLFCFGANFFLFQPCFSLIDPLFWLFRCLRFECCWSSRFTCLLSASLLRWAIYRVGERAMTCDASFCCQTILGACRWFLIIMPGILQTVPGVSNGSMVAGGAHWIFIQPARRCTFRFFAA